MRSILVSFQVISVLLVCLWVSLKYFYIQDKYHSNLSIARLCKLVQASQKIATMQVQCRNFLWLSVGGSPHVHKLCRLSVSPLSLPLPCLLRYFAGVGKFIILVLCLHLFPFHLNTSNNIIALLCSISLAENSNVTILYFSSISFICQFHILS